MSVIRREAGFTLIEIIAASAIAAVIAGGSMMAYVAAIRMMRVGDTPAMAEAGGFAQQTIERFRNMIACDSSWFDPATCAPRPLPPNIDGMPVDWISDNLPPADPDNAQSMLNAVNNPDGPPLRCYRVVSACVGDCFEVEVRVFWNQSAISSCDDL